MTAGPVILTGALLAVVLVGCADDGGEGEDSSHRLDRRLVDAAYRRCSRR